MATETPLKTRLREAWSEAWDKGNVDALDGVLAEGFVRTTQGSDRSLTAAELKEDILTTRRAFPDLVTTIDDIIQDGNQVAIFWNSVGTHQAELLDIPATKRRVVTYGSNLCTITDNKLTHERVTWDPRHLLNALGISTVRHD